MKKLNDKKFINVAVLVSGGGTNLQAIIDAEKRGEIKHAKIKLVLSNNANAFALTRAKNNGIESFVVSKNKGYDAEFENKVIKILKENDVDMVVLAGFMAILSINFVKEFENRIINVHPALIPSFCGEGYYGLKVHQSALDYGVKVTGATVHFVNEIADGGKIIMQKAVNVKPGDTPEILQQRVMKQAEWVILPKSIEKVAKILLK